MLTRIPPGLSSAILAYYLIRSPTQPNCFLPQLNNRVSHLVLNKSNVKRVQMVVDVAEDPRSPRRLKPGTICNYEHAVMVCPQENTLPDY